MWVWLLGSGDPSVDVRRPRTTGDEDDAGGETERLAQLAVAARWRVYAESYVLTHGTELVGNATSGGKGGRRGTGGGGGNGKARMPFLVRCVPFSSFALLFKYAKNSWMIQYKKTRVGHAAEL
jgi:hypothetical protein